MRLVVFIGCLAVLTLSACQRQEQTSQDEITAPAPLSSVEAPVGAGKTDFSGDFNALGNEPFWAVRVRQTGISLERPDLATVDAPYIRPEIDGDKAAFKAMTASGHPLNVTISHVPCIDGMSGFGYGYTAQVRIGEETLTGCATRPDAKLDEAE